MVETESATREKVFQNLFRFTFAGDFFAEDVTDKHVCFDLFGIVRPPDFEGSVKFSSLIDSYFVPIKIGDEVREQIASHSAARISDELYETLRIERGIPKYGVDMDETTVVPEVALDGLISYNKGCYIGQEIIARIHFRGHVAKQLTGLVLSQPVAAGTELNTLEGKAAGRLTSATYSPALEKTIALGFVRYANLARDTKLLAGEMEATVVGLPFEV